ncbi:hypothetical protein [uncultured Nitrospira sp.]|uniref:hypothetical protein n=1 Tax=uncultured Nitrospira sp. TaxID=157176 RepID=UPI0031407AD8
MDKRIQAMRISLFALALFFIVGMGAVLASSQGSLNVPEPVSGHSISLEEITPADVLARVQLLRDTLELIRFEMGKPLVTPSDAIATNIHSHEAYFQALTLYHKADRLTLELTGSTGIPPEPISLSTLAPLHIWKMVNASYLRILTIKEELGLKEIISERPEDSATSLTETGRAIVQANRQLNLLQERHFSPSDVSQQVLLASQYAKRLLSRFPPSTVTLETPPLVRGKQPADVFLRLVECYAILEKVAQQSGIPVLHLDLPAAKSVGISQQLEPSDVYDMATLLVSDLAFFYTHLKKHDSLKPISYPGRTFPSLVYQQATVLLHQLKALEQLLANDPEWLSR